ncbi:hypothetical protein BKA59DRAFT_467657 [Fusarium tricinctum]|uniref:Uncharacterized protein n=1 Tax=Fusarium tricinctum TaxID=61284 RepID=A0A8K0WER8_9HYPO|nr:hypothetical protein BKA59DRAFT_467657 [Fusarium tricinctum]
MSSAAKKRRHGSSSRKDLQDEDDDDDDELASHPNEIRIRRDPDIQFALKRANADHKLQSTMAHIIEKYSRNFEGIGDEIDMETGEIVVNNGHLRSMRDEGDVEGLWVEGDSNIDEDEGILLGDLTDEYSEDEEQVNQVRDSQDDNEKSQTSPTKEQDTHTYMKDQGMNADQTTTSDPKTTSNSDTLPQNESSDTPFDSEPLGDPRFGPPPFASSASLGYGQPPPGFGPWGMMSGIPMQAWGRDDIPPYFNMPYSMPGPWFTGGRYDFPINNGQTSIWGRSWAKRTKRAGSMKGPSKLPTNKDTDATIAGEGTDVTHSNPKPKEQESHNQGFPSSDRTINATDEDDDLMLSGITDPAPAIEPDLIPPGEESLSREDNAQAHAESVLGETGGNSIDMVHQHDETDDTGRRRSGRVRKQTEYMGKISWNDAKEWRKSCQTLSVELYRANPLVREEYRSVDQSIDNTEEERDSPLEKEQINESTTKEWQADVAFQKQVIPDSQDTATPFNSSAPEASQSRQPYTKLDGSGCLPTMELSDDEAPLVLSRIRAPRRHAGTSSATTHLPDKPPIKDQTLSIEPVLSRVNSPARTTKGVTPTVETRPVDVLDQATQSLKRKRGRPRGSTIKDRPVSSVIRAEPAPLSSAKNASSATTNGLVADRYPNPQKRRIGRPGKSEVASLEAEAETQHPSEKAGPSEGAIPYGEAAQRKPIHKKPDSEATQASPHLSHELKWLLKTKPNSPASDKYVRPRKSRENFQQGDDNGLSTEEAIEKPKEVAQKERVISEENSPSQKQQELLPEDDTVMEEAPENGEPLKVQDDQPDTTQSPSPTHNRETHDNGDSYYDQEPLRDNPFSDQEAFEDGLTPDEEESLPALPNETTVQEASTPRKPKDTLAPLPEPPSSSQRPHTPRHTSILTTRAPSSRRSLLSFVSDSESDTDGSRDELTRRVKSTSKTASVRPSTKRVWHSIALTREIHRTPSKRRLHGMSSPIGAVKTPGGTVRTCGVDGFQCGRDYCFTCI